MDKNKHSVGATLFPKRVVLLMAVVSFQLSDSKRSKVITETPQETLSRSYDYAPIVHYEPLAGVDEPELPILREPQSSFFVG